MPLIQKDIVSLDFYKLEYEPQLKDYYLPEEQQKYTSFPLDAVKKCETDNDRYPIVILKNNIPAGFFVLHGWEGVKAYSNNTEAILLRAYSVNAAYQGKGIASASIQLLPSFVKNRFPSKTEIILAVNHRNEKAQRVYQKSGFIDKGVRVMGRKGELLILHIDL
jgi:RimJ/RimL family protein N-acetyltransferase